MALSQDMILWVCLRVAEARSIIENPNSTQSQRSVARLVLETWRVR